MSDLERLKSGNTDREGQRRVVIGQLAQNNCGPQYSRAAAQTPGPGGFLEPLLGGISTRAAARADRAVLFALSACAPATAFFSRSPTRPYPTISPTTETCQRMCPACEAMLFPIATEAGTLRRRPRSTARPYSAAAQCVQVPPQFTSNARAAAPARVGPTRWELRRARRSSRATSW